MAGLPRFRFLESPVRRMQAVLALLLLGVLWIVVAGPSYGEAMAEIGILTAAGEQVKVPWELDADVGVQVAARFNAAVLLVLLVTARWWLRPWSAAAKGGAEPLAAPSPGWLVWAVLAVVVMGTGLRLPLAGKSLWWDELWSIRQCSHGSWKEDPKAEAPGALKFSPTTWKRCAFYYQKPTNHAPMSLMQKASLDGWRKVSGAPRHGFNELAARLPALGLSALSIGLVALLLGAWGAPPTAVVLGALVMAIHPMAVRYGVDSRGYAMVMPLVLSALLAGTRLIRAAGRDATGWVWLGLNQCLWLWAFPHGVLDVLVMTLGLAVLLGLAQKTWRDRVSVWLRLVVAHGLAGLLFIQLFLPNAVQATRWAGQENQGHTLDAGILKNTVSQLLTGLRWIEPAEAAGAGQGLPGLSTAWVAPWVAALLLAGAGAVLLSGVVRALMAGRRAVWLMAGLLISAVGFALLTYAVELYYYPRFAIALVPVVAVGVVLGWPRHGSRMKAIHGLLLAGLILTAWRGDQVLLSRPIEPVKDVAEWIRDKAPAESVVLAYGHGREAVMVYLPSAKPVETAAQVEAEVREAQASGKALFVVVGHPEFNRTMLPGGFAVFEDANRFQEAVRLTGVESELQYAIHRMIR